MNLSSNTVFWHFLKIRVFKLTRTLVLYFLFAVFSALGFAASWQNVTVPLVIEDHRLFLDAQFVRKDGSLRTARLWVDTGTPDFQIAKNLARDLGLDLSGPTIKSEDGIPQVQVQLPGLQMGALSLDLRSARPMVIIGPQRVFAGSLTEGNLPATVLMHYQLVLDILHRRLTLAHPGSTAKGTRVPCLVQPKTGMVQLAAAIDGTKYSLALDSGAPYSMISSELIKSWGAQHTDWAQVVGAAGPATLFGIPPLLQAPMMRVPLINWAGLSLKNVGALGMDAEFVSWYSRKTAAPVIGFLSWNVLKAYRVTIDYRASTAYFQKQGQINARDMDVVGLALARSRTGGFAIVAVAQKDGKPTVEGVQPGDKLIKVDEVDMTHADMRTVVDALAGRPGDVRTLLLDRKGVTFTVKTKVTRLI